MMMIARFTPVLLLTGVRGAQEGSRPPQGPSNEAPRGNRPPSPMVRLQGLADDAKWKAVRDSLPDIVELSASKSTGWPYGDPSGIYVKTTGGQVAAMMQNRISKGSDDYYSRWRSHMSKHSRKFKDKFPVYVSLTNYVDVPAYYFTLEPLFYMMYGGRPGQFRMPIQWSVKSFGSWKRKSDDEEDAPHVLHGRVTMVADEEKNAYYPKARGDNGFLLKDMKFFDLEEYVQCGCPLPHNEQYTVAPLDNQQIATFSPKKLKENKILIATMLKDMSKETAALYQVADRLYRFMDEVLMKKPEESDEVQALTKALQEAAMAMDLEKMQLLGKKLKEIKGRQQPEEQKMQDREDGSSRTAPRGPPFSLEERIAIRNEAIVRLGLEPPVHEEGRKIRQQQNNGIMPKALGNVPYYKKEENNPYEMAHCQICLDDYTGEEAKHELLKLRCNHIYHRHCIERWAQRARNCPMCKTDIQDGDLHQNN